MQCTFNACEQQQLARGYCNRHYKQLRSNGTLKRKQHREVHGMYGAYEYWTWGHIVSRCYNPNDKRYLDWGGRGIRVCNRYRYSFVAFYKDVGKRPNERTIDRINNDMHYSCGRCEQCVTNGWLKNVRWATAEQQQVNKRIYRSNTTGYKNITWNKRQKQWSVAIERNSKTLYTGTFAKLDAAIKARDKVLMLYNERHGNTKY